MADRNALARATESTDSPTPGYLYNDIAKTVSASPAACNETITYLIRRLSSKQNHNIKYKCLKVLQMVSLNAASRGMFKRALCADTTAVATIKECLNFRGPPDAVHGDMIYVKVRTQAKETLDAVYSDTPSSVEQQNTAAGGGGSFGSSGGYGSQGYGNGGGNMSGGYGGGGGGYNPSATAGPPQAGARKMEGIGNPMFKDPRLEQANQVGVGDMTVGDIVSAAKEGFKGIIKDPLARNVGVPTHAAPQRSSYNPGSMPGYGSSSNSSGQGWNSAPPGQAQLAQSTGGAWTMASNRGPNAVSSADTTRDAYSRSTTGGVGGSWASSSTTTNSIASQSRAAAHNPPPPRTGGAVVNIHGSAGDAATDGTYERNLIQELCPPGGMKAEPPADKLEAFQQAVPSLNADLVCPALLDALEDGQPWIIRAKALCVMETCILTAEKSKNIAGGNGNNAYADFFHACAEEIEPLATHNRSAVRDPAKRVLKALGLDVPERTGAAAPVAPKVVPTVTAPPPNLLDFNDDEPVAPTVPPPPVPSEAPPAPPVPSITTVAATSGGDSLFGGMSVKSNTTAPPIPPTEAPPVPAPAPVPDMLGVVEDVVTPSPPAPAPVDMFGSMTLKAAPTTTTAPATMNANEVGKENIVNESKVEDSSSASGSKSGFSFMNSGTSAPAYETAKPDSTTTTKETFDPLLSLGMDNGGSKQMNPMQQQQQQQMAMNPQMAAAYQQQILMMQMQMQQMQMANGNPAQAQMMMMQQNAAAGAMLQNQTNKTTAAPTNTTTGPNMMMVSSMRQTPVMGATGGHGVATSFAFMDDPAKAKREASNKQFDFVQDAMNGAK